MKLFLKINFFHIKINRNIISICLFIIYLIILPLLLTINLDTIDGIITCYQYMQKLLFIPCVFLLLELFKPYVEIELKELIQSMDKNFQFLYILFNYLFVQILLFPIYAILVFNNSIILNFILYFMNQVFILYIGIYLICKLCSSTTFVLGISILYLLLFSLPFREIALGNIFLMELPSQQQMLSYFVYSLVFEVFCVFLGYIIENINYFIKVINKI